MGCCAANYVGNGIAVHMGGEKPLTILYMKELVSNILYKQGLFLNFAVAL